jgi:hypothetical protein
MVCGVSRSHASEHACVDVYTRVPLYARRREVLDVQLDVRATRSGAHGSREHSDVTGPCYVQVHCGHGIIVHVPLAPGVWASCGGLRLFWRLMPVEP